MVRRWTRLGEIGASSTRFTFQARPRVSLLWKQAHAILILQQSLAFVCTYLTLCTISCLVSYSPASSATEELNSEKLCAFVDVGACLL